MDKFDEYLEKAKKQFGKASIFTINDNIDINIDVISTGSIRLNEALMVGGIPKGRITEIYGSEGSGKTTLALHVLSEAQKNGKAGFIDAEHSLDVKYAERIGVDINSLIISQPECGEEALSIVESFVRSGHFELVVIDSVAALVPRAELEGEFGDANMGLMARMMSQAMRKLTGFISKANTAVVFINQTRSTIGAYSYKTTTGGNALKFYSTLRLKTVKKEQRKSGDDIVGQKTLVEVVKNKVGIPFKKAEFDIRFGEGIDKYGEILDIAVEQEIIEKSGVWYSFDTNQLGQGRENTIEFLKENKDLALEIKNKLEISGEQDSKKKTRPEEKTTKGVFENSQKKRQKKK
jgi:recombination protein RecA